MCFHAYKEVNTGQPTHKTVKLHSVEERDSGWQDGRERVVCVWCMFVCLVCICVCRRRLVCFTV